MTLSALRICPIAREPFADAYTRSERFEVGQRIELHPACDLWVRGARYGTITRITAIETPRLDATVVHVRMDHPSVKRIQKFTDLTWIRHADTL